MRTFLISLALLVVSGTTPATPPTEYQNGDTTLDGILCFDDATTIIYSLYQTGEPLPCPETADANRNGTVELGDALVILSYLFKGTGLVICPIICSPSDDDYQEPYTY